jgi:hypothetical protein
MPVSVFRFDRNDCWLFTDTQRNADQRPRNLAGRAGRERGGLLKTLILGDFRIRRLTIYFV